MVPKGMRNTFAFTGNLLIPHDDARNGFVRRFDKDGRKMISVRFGISDAGTNREFVEVFGVQNDVIKTYDTSNQKLDVNWADRFDDKIISKVASYRKYGVNLDGNRKEFITTYDMAEYLALNLASYDKRVTVTGQMSRDWFNGRYSTTYSIENVYTAKETTPSGLHLFADIAYNKDCVDLSDWKTLHKIYLDGYVASYVSSERRALWFPVRFTFDANDYNLTDEMNVRRVKYIRRYIETTSSDMVRMKWAINCVNGIKEVPFDESLLTPTQKEEIALGFATVEDFKPSGTIYGDKVVEFKLVRPDTKSKAYTDGLVDMGISFEEFQDDVYVPVQVEDFAAAMNAPDNQDALKKEEEDLFGDLFGA